MFRMIHLSKIKTLRHFIRIFRNQSISGPCFHYKPPEDIRKPRVFRRYKMEMVRYEFKINTVSGHSYLVRSQSFSKN